MLYDMYMLCQLIAIALGAPACIVFRYCMPHILHLPKEKKDNYL